MTINSDQSPKTGKPKSPARQDRLADALRANLRRRKDQKRGRDDAGAALTPDAAPAGDAAPLDAAMDNNTE